MKRTLVFLSLSAAALGLTGCNDDDNHTVTVTDLTAGAYTVSIGDAGAPTVGKYFADADGQRLLILNNVDDVADRLYRRSSASSSWVAVPAPTTDITVTLLNNDALPVVALAVADLVGSYSALVSANVVAAFSVAADGALSAGSTTCKLSGMLSAGSMPNTLKLNLNASGCGTMLPAKSAGVVTVDRDDEPAAFRLVADDGKSILDLRAYRE